MALKAKHDKSYYKDENAWLKAVYRKNKDIIDDAMSERNVSKRGKQLSNFTKFKNEYEGYKDVLKDDFKTKAKLSKESLAALERSRTFTSAEDSAMNAMIADMKAAGQYSYFRSLNRSKSGRFLSAVGAFLEYVGNYNYHYHVDGDPYNIIVIEYKYHDRLKVYSYEEWANEEYSAYDDSNSNDN